MRGFATSKRAQGQEVLIFQPDTGTDNVACWPLGNSLTTVTWTLLEAHSGTLAIDMIPKGVMYCDTKRYYKELQT